MVEIATQIANFIKDTTFSKLPEYLVDQAKLIILDAIGCGVRGHSTECGRISTQFAKMLGGPEEATILGSNDKVSMTNAAFANGQLIGALDYHPMGAMHDVPSLVATSLALAEKVPTSGKNLILSIVLGLEINRRIAYAAQLEGISSSVFGATISAGKLLNLNVDKLAIAIGLAGYICIPDTMIRFVHSHPHKMVKYGPTGWIAQAGITSALLADMGFTGDTSIFDTEWNFWRLTGKTKSDASSVLADIGKSWQTHIEFKLYPGGV
jgi:2-methylcitrate dehydratase PrpD